MQYRQKVSILLVSRYIEVSSVSPSTTQVTMLRMHVWTGQMHEETRNNASGYTMWGRGIRNTTKIQIWKNVTLH